LKKLFYLIFVSFFLIFLFTSCTPGVEKPPIPKLLNPQNKAEEIDQEVVFSWELDKDTNLELTYEIQIFQIIDSSKTKIIDEKNLKQRTFNSNSLGFDKKYSWKVIVTAANGEKTESEEFEFTTRDTPFETTKSVPSYSIPDQKIGENREITISIDNFSKTYSQKNYDGNYRYEIIEGPGTVKEGKYNFKGDYDSAGTYDISIKISSLDESTVTNFKLYVENVNRAPEISTKEIETSENATVQIDLGKNFTDPDGDVLEFTLLEGSGTISNGVYSQFMDYNSAGTYDVKIRVTDGEATQTALIKLNISDLNRKPEIIIEDINTEENSDISIDLNEKASDPDGDNIKFNLLEGPGKIEDGVYKLSLDYETAGTYDVKVSVSDGKTEKTVNFTVKVEDVNRTVNTYGKEEFSVNEAEEITLDLNKKYSDPDGDRVTFSIVKIPEGLNAEIKDGVFTFKPNYDQSGEYSFEIVISDGKEKVTEIYTVKVEDVNRKPVISDEGNEEKDSLLLEDSIAWSITDPDGDKLLFDLYLSENNPPELYRENMDINSLSIADLIPGKKYYWKVVARDKNDVETETPVKEFEIEDRIPVIEEYTMPEDNSTGIGDEINLEWKAEDPDNTSLTYDLYFGKEENPPLYKSDIDSNEFKIDSLEQNTAYFWKIVAKDDTGSVSESAVKKFRTNIPLSGIITPNDVLISKDNIILSWKKIDDPDGETVLYDLYVGENGKLNLHSENISDNEMKIEGLSGDKEYQWKIVAKESGGSTIDSPVFTFRTSFGPGAVNWIFKSNYDIRSSPAISPDGSILIGSDDNYLYSISKKGYLLWKFFVGNSIYSSPAVGNDLSIYIAAGYTNLYCIDNDGNKKWEYSFDSSIYSSPAVDNDGNVYIGASDTHLYSLDNNGKLVWKFKTSDEIRSSPAVDSDGNIYFGSDDGNLYCLSENGTLKWKYSTGGYIRSSPAIDDENNVYFGSFDGYLYSLNNNGALRWKFKAEDEIRSSPAIYLDGTVYFGSFDNNIYALNSDGSLKWKFRVNGPLWSSSPAIGQDGTVYIGTWEKELIAVSNEGTLKWKLELDNYIRSSPVIDENGSIYIGTYGASLYSVQSGSNGISKESPWPMFRKDERHSGVK